MPVGLTANQLRALRAEYGSDEQIIAARPELADALRERKAAGGLVADLAQAMKSRPELLEPSEPYEPHALEVRQLELLQEIADDGPGRRARKSGNDPAPDKGGRDPIPIEHDTFWTIVEMAIDGASRRAIWRATDERVDRTKISMIVDLVVADRRRARRWLRGQKLPPRFLATDAGVFLPGSKPRS